MSQTIKFDKAGISDIGNSTYLMLRVPDYQEEQKARKLVVEMPDKLHVAEIKQHRNKRSLDSNALLWAICQEIGNSITPPLSKEEVYRQAVRDVGVYEPLPIKNEAVESFRRRWEMKGLGWFADIVDDSKLDGYKLVFAYYGSSTYDSREMSTLLECLIDEARQMGITLSTTKYAELG